MTSSSSTSGRTWAKRGRQALGLAIVVLAFAPIYRLMDTSVEAPFRRVNVEVAEVTLQLAWWGTVMTLLVAWLLARLVPARVVRSAANACIARLIHVSSSRYAATLAALSAGLAGLTQRMLHKGFFTNVDEMASAIHARYLAQGMMAGPTFSVPEFWLIPNTLVVAEGWVSQFPPAHLLAMSGLIWLGVPMILGPLFFGAMSGLIALSLPRLLPDRPEAARVAALVVAVCPFLVLLGGGSMSHVSAGAFGAAVLYAALRARDGSTLWAVAAGAAVGLMVSGRPMVGLVLGTLFTLGLWVPAALNKRKAGAKWFIQRALGVVAGGAPFAVLLGWYGYRLFGSPFTLGYLAAFGDRHRLGFHVDPWGNAYGLREAVAFTSTDLLTLGVQLFETPFPMTAVVGLYLLLASRLSRGVGLLVAWALLPVLSNGYYWFHSVRMLFEAAPAWATLAVIGTVDLASESMDGGTSKLATRGREMAAWAIVVGLVVALVWGVPARWQSYAWSQGTLSDITAPSPPTSEATIVFVHTSWNERISATLQGAGGMRQDSIISALRRNTNCDLHLYSIGREAQAREGSEVTLPEVDLDQITGTPADIGRARTPSGTILRIREGEPFTQACLREVQADRFGAIALAPLLWQGDLPGIEEGHPLFVRDLGPEKNQRLLDAYPARVAFVFLRTEAQSAPELVPYAEAMEILWSRQLSPR